jgi:LPS export ABC transporter protein LptC
MERRRYAITAVLILFAALLWWLSELLRLPEALEVSERPTVPDYRIEGLRATQMNRDGRAVYELSADRFTHIPGRHMAYLDKPVLIQFEADGTVIDTRADKAEFPDDGRSITMIDNVRIIQKRGKAVLSDVSANRTRIDLER